MYAEIYNDGDLVVFRRNARLYIRYDAGSHQIAIREDEISTEEANLVMKSQEEATKVLFALQKRLEQAGLDPYISNI